MARIVITIVDKPEDGDVPVNIITEFEPTLHMKERDTHTDAQRMALVMLDAALKHCGGKVRTNEVR